MATRNKPDFTTAFQAGTLSLHTVVIMIKKTMGEQGVGPDFWHWIRLGGPGPSQADFSFVLDKQKTRDDNMQAPTQPLVIGNNRPAPVASWSPLLALRQLALACRKEADAIGNFSDFVKGPKDVH